MTATDVIDQLRAEARASLEGTADRAALDAWRVAYLGRKGRLTGVLRGLGALSVEERKSLGAAANALKDELETAHEARSEEMRQAALSASIETGRLDVTLPARPHARGGLHPVTRTLRMILDAFRSMGFSIVEGPEVELDYYNFEALRIPRGPPGARYVGHDVGGRGRAGVGGRCCCGRTPRRRRSASWSSTSLPSASPSPAGPTASRRRTLRTSG